MAMSVMAEQDEKYRDITVESSGRGSSLTTDLSHAQFL